MLEIPVNIEVYCAKCLSDLCQSTVVTYIQGVPCIKIQPCMECLSKAFNAGYGEACKKVEDAYNDGYAEGYKDGKRVS